MSEQCCFGVDSVVLHLDVTHLGGRQAGEWGRRRGQSSGLGIKHQGTRVHGFRTIRRVRAAEACNGYPRMVAVAVGAMRVTPVPLRLERVMAKVSSVSGFGSAQIGTLTDFTLAPTAKLSVLVTFPP